jgi:hypothetical protein
MSDAMMAEFSRAKARHEANPSKPVVVSGRQVTRAEDLAARRVQWPSYERRLT